MTTLYLCGAGNTEGVRLAVRVNRIQRRWDHIVLLDDDPTKHGRSSVGVEVVGPFAKLAEVGPESAEVINLVARTTARRRSAQEKIASFGLPFAQLIDPCVDLNATTVSDDVIVFHNATVGAHATVAEQSVVFMGAVAGHGSRIGRGCILAPNAVVNARVDLGDETYVGTNASVLPDLTIGSRATIAANSAVVQDVPLGATVIGVPGKNLMMRRNGEVADGRQRAEAATCTEES